MCLRAWLLFIVKLLPLPHHCVRSPRSSPGRHPNTVTSGSKRWRLPSSQTWELKTAVKQTTGSCQGGSAHASVYCLWCEDIWVSVYSAECLCVCVRGVWWDSSCTIFRDIINPQRPLLMTHDTIPSAGPSSLLEIQQQESGSTDHWKSQGVRESCFLLAFPPHCKERGLLNLLWRDHEVWIGCNDWMKSRHSGIKCIIDFRGSSYKVDMIHFCFRTAATTNKVLSLYKIISTSLPPSSKYWHWWHPGLGLYSTNQRPVNYWTGTTFSPWFLQSKHRQSKGRCNGRLSYYSSVINLTKCFGIQSAVGRRWYIKVILLTHL